MLGIDGANIVRNFVLALDPSSKESFRRVSAIEREEETIPQEVFDKQKEVDLDNARKGRYEAFKNEYQRNINLQIINGTLDHIPENLEADAEKYAEEKIKEEDKKGVTENTEVSEPQVLENISTQEIVDPVTEPCAETEVQSEVTQTVNTVVEPIVDTPVEVTPTEPVDPTEVPSESTTPESEVVPTEEAPTTEPVVETIEEKPTVETTSETITPTVEPTVEAPIEEEVTTTSKKKKSA